MHGSIEAWEADAARCRCSCAGTTAALHGLMKNTSLLRAALCGGCWLMPGLVLAQQPPDEQPKPKEEQVPKKAEEPAPEGQMPNEQMPKEQTPKTEVEQPQGTEAAQILTPIFDFSRNQIECALTANA